MRKLGAFLAGMGLVLAALVAWPGSARADGAPPSSAGQRWALEVNGYYVSAEVDSTGDDTGMLRARATTIGSWETFTLFTDQAAGAGYGATISLRSEADGLYASTEMSYTGSDQYMLRARATNTGSYERYTVVPLGGGTYALKSVASGLYVSAEFYDTGNDTGMLRARSATVGSWETFTFVKVGGQGATGAAPAPTAVAAGQQEVASWNLCSNNNTSSACAFQFGAPAATGQAAADAVATALGGRRPDAIFFQEICEKDAKPLELELEKEYGTGWDVRFAPTVYQVRDPDGSFDPLLTAQKECADSSGTAASGGDQDRGAFGIALAVADANTWYQAYTLVSPDGKEQRPALCATLPAQGTAYCTAHLSSGEYKVGGVEQGDDPSNVYRPQQAQQFAGIVGTLAGEGFTVVYGGDMNTVAASAASADLVPLYAGHQECAGQQQNPDGPYTGAPTNGSNKIDYLWGPASAAQLCTVVDPGLSDHQLIDDRITL